MCLPVKTMHLLLPEMGLWKHWLVTLKLGIKQGVSTLKSVTSAVISSMVEAFSATEKHCIANTQSKISALHKISCKQTNKQNILFTIDLGGVYRRYVLSLHSYTKHQQSHLPWYILTSELSSFLAWALLARSLFLQHRAESPLITSWRNTEHYIHS